MITKKYTHQGKRENQEDSIGSIENTAYIVCDGVGGHSKGEVASGTTLEYMLQEIKKDASFSKESIQNLIHQAQLHLNQQLVQMPTAEGMGTTLASLFISKEAFYIAHIGDSRVYWVKPQEKKIWHTWDHSLVGNLMQMGQITREDGRFHPNGNRISKAIIANSDNKTQKADIAKMTNVSVGDLFLICSDGVTESWSEYELLDLLCDTTKSSEIKLALIKEKCAKESKDNNTAFLLEVDEESAINGIDNEEISWLTLFHFQKDFEDYQKNNEVIEITENDILPTIAAEEVRNSAFVPNQENKTKEIKLENNSNKKFLLLMLSFIFIGVAGHFVYSKLNSKKPKPKIEKINNLKKREKSQNENLFKQQNQNNEVLTTSVEINNKPKSDVIIVNNKPIITINSINTKLLSIKNNEDKIKYLDSINKTMNDPKNKKELSAKIEDLNKKIKNEKSKSSLTDMKKDLENFKIKNASKEVLVNFRNTVNGSNMLNEEDKKAILTEIDNHIITLK